mgnify:CR=1 FL=1
MNQFNFKDIQYKQHWEDFVLLFLFFSDSWLGVIKYGLVIGMIIVISMILFKEILITFLVTFSLALFIAFMQIYAQRIVYNKSAKKKYDADEYITDLSNAYRHGYNRSIDSAKKHLQSTPRSEYNPSRKSIYTERLRK